jgi:hypothetical protein
MGMKTASLLLGLFLLLQPADDFKRERNGKTDNIKNAGEGKAPPELKAGKWMNTPDGKPLTWKEMRGKVVLIDLWAFW